MSKDKKKNKNENPFKPQSNISEATPKSYYPNMVSTDGVVYTSFMPIGYDHEFQSLMTKLLHGLVMKFSDKTMSEMGYMHQIAVLFENGAVKLRMYFHPELATYEEHAANGRVIRKPIPQFGIMNGYFFILPGDSIDLTAVTGIEKIMMPKAKIKYNERGNLSVKIKEDATMKLQDAFYVDCNLLTTVASVLNIKLTDPNFAVKVNTISQVDKKRAILVDGRNNTYQIWIHVTFSADDSISLGYNPEDAIPYLTAIAVKAADAKQTQKKLMREAEDQTEKKNKDDKRKLSKYL